MNIVVYCGASSETDQKWLDVAKSVGKWIAESGNTLVTRASNSEMQCALAVGEMNQYELREF